MEIKFRRLGLMLVGLATGALLPATAEAQEVPLPAPVAVAYYTLQIDNCAPGYYGRVINHGGPPAPVAMTDADPFTGAPATAALTCRGNTYTVGYYRDDNGGGRQWLIDTFNSEYGQGLAAYDATVTADLTAKVTALAALVDALNIALMDRLAHIPLELATDPTAYAMLSGRLRSDLFAQVVGYVQQGAATWMALNGQPDYQLQVVDSITASGDIGNIELAAVSETTMARCMVWSRRGSYRQIIGPCPTGSSIRSWEPIAIQSDGA